MATFTNLSNRTRSDRGLWQTLESNLVRQFSSPGSLDVSTKGKQMRRARSLAGASGGFTIIEVILSIGVIATVVVVMLGMLSVLMVRSQESWQETRAAIIARQIMSDLSSGVGVNGDLSKGLNATPVIVTLSGTTAFKDQIFYNIDGIPVAQADPSVMFEADIDVEVAPTDSTGSLGSTGSTSTPPTAARPDFKKVEVSVHPVNQSATIAPYVFTSRIAPKSMDPSESTNQTASN